MPQLYLPPVTHGAFYYQLAQLVAFGLFVGLLLGQGVRRGYPWRQWLPLVAAATLALMLGCQLVFLPLGHWLAWLRGDATVAHTLAHGPRSVVGGAAASLLAVLALKRVLGFRGGAVLDAFAGPLCWALAAQCVGCGLAGCCWGEMAAPGSLGVGFGPGTLPYLAQQAQGLLPLGAVHALPVVPTQLYHLLLCAGTGLVLHTLRRRAGSWPGGSHYLLAMSLLCLGRFALEFWRDPASEPLLSAPLMLAGFSLLKIQGLLLLEGLALLGGWGWLVRRRIAAPVAPAATQRHYSAWVALGLLAATARLGSSLPAPAEVLTLQALLLLVLLAEARALLPRLGWALPRLAGLPLAVLLGGIVLLSTAQAPAPQSAPAAGEPTKTLTFSGGLLSNYHEAEEDILEDNMGCSSSQPLLLHQQVRAAGGEVALTTTTADHTGTWGGGLWVGQQRIEAQPLPTTSYRFLPTDTTLRYALADVHLYREVQHERGWLSTGVRVGLHLGSLGYYSYFDSGNSRKNTWLMPELMVRLGNPRLLYGQADLCYGAENALGAYTGRVALGSGLGQIRGSQLLVGYAHSPHRTAPGMAFVSANLRLPTSTGLSALSLEPYFATDFGQHQQLSLKLNYRLARQR